MKIKKFVIGMFAVNCYVIICEETKKAAIIDPGGYTPKILDYIKENEADLEAIILTHAHGDHIGGIANILKEYKVPVLLHKDDASMLNDESLNLSKMIGGNPVELVADRLLEDYDTINVGNIELQVIHTPGHTPGCICLKSDNIMFTGDTLFANSVGRTDFPYSSTKKMIKAIKEKLLVLDDNVSVFPGHGPDSDIKTERTYNPFIV